MDGTSISGIVTGSRSATLSAGDLSARLLRLGDFGGQAAAGVVDDLLQRLVIERRHDRSHTFEVESRGSNVLREDGECLVDERGIGVAAQTEVELLAEGESFRRQHGKRSLGHDRLQDDRVRRCFGRGGLVAEQEMESPRGPGQ